MRVVVCAAIGFSYLARVCEMTLVMSETSQIPWRSDWPFGANLSARNTEKEKKKKKKKGREEATRARTSSVSLHLKVVPTAITREVASLSGGWSLAGLMQCHGVDQRHHYCAPRRGNMAHRRRPQLWCQGWSRHCPELVVRGATGRLYSHGEDVEVKYAPVSPQAIARGTPLRPTMAAAAMNVRMAFTTVGVLEGCQQH
jgi:hypothetical protein